MYNIYFLQITPNTLIKAVVEYVRNMHSVDDLNAVALQVFGKNSTQKYNKFKQCVIYYSSCNKTYETQLSKFSGKNAIFSFYSKKFQQDLRILSDTRFSISNKP